MNAVVLHQIVGSLAAAISSLMAVQKALEELLPKEEPRKENVEDKNTPLPPEDEVVALDVDDGGLASDDVPRRKDSPPTSPRPKISLDGKISLSFEGTISVHE